MCWPWSSPTESARAARKNTFCHRKHVACTACNWRSATIFIRTRSVIPCVLFHSAIDCGSLPTTLLRPIAPVGSWTGLYRWLVVIDPPNNAMPCGHIIGPVIVAWFLVRERPAWRWPLMGMVALSASSIAVTWQHRPIDIVVGMGIGAIAIATVELLSGRVWPKAPNRTPEPMTTSVMPRAAARVAPAAVVARLFRSERGPKRHEVW